MGDLTWKPRALARAGIAGPGVGRLSSTLKQTRSRKKMCIRARRRGHHPPPRPPSRRCFHSRQCQGSPFSPGRERNARYLAVSFTSKNSTRNFFEVSLLAPCTIAAWPHLCVQNVVIIGAGKNRGPGRTARCLHFEHAHRHHPHQHRECLRAPTGEHGSRKTRGARAHYM